jgi:hypothetical protein
MEATSVDGESFDRQYVARDCHYVTLERTAIASAATDSQRSASVMCIEGQRPGSRHAYPQKQQRAVLAIISEILAIHVHLRLPVMSLVLRSLSATSYPE